MPVKMAHPAKLPPCYVVVHKLPLEDITRLTTSPLFVAHKCGRCRKFSHYGVQCPTCSVHYHYECAFFRRECCGTRLLPAELPEAKCNRCNGWLGVGPECPSCHKRYHSYCVSPFEKCCGVQLFESPALKPCAECELGVSFGPRCPLCGKIYHVECVDKKLPCCQIKFVRDEERDYNCRKCGRKVFIGAPVCQICGSMYHKGCLPRVKNCCGKRIPLEVFFLPSFQYMISNFRQGEKRKSYLAEEVVDHSHSLRSIIREMERVKKKHSCCQTDNPLDNITITNVKTETEEEVSEMEFPSSPPVLERETSTTPEASFSSQLGTLETHLSEEDDSLKNLFDFLYKMVKKFPPNLQTQVKVDLFKIVTEAEMKMQCNLIDNIQNGTR